MAELTGWQNDVASALRHWIDDIDDFVDARWRAFRRRYRLEGVPSIQPYIGYGNEDFRLLHGRVLTNPPAELPSETDSWWDNLSNTYQRFESDEVPGVSIELCCGNQTERVVTDEEGYFHFQSSEPFDPPVNPTGWSQWTARIVDDDRTDAYESLKAGRLVIPPSTAQIGIISDVDDTILHTGITSLLTAVKLTFLGNARTRKPLDGAAALYRALRDGPHKKQLQHNPVFYISSSPWNLFDLLEDFLELNNFPDGPVLLRDLGFDENKFLTEGHGHKLRKALNIVDAYPTLPFVMFGDSGQQDAELYIELATQRPNRIAAIFIRDVDPGQVTRYDRYVSDRGVSAAELEIPFHAIENSVQAAEILVAMGLIAKESLSGIGRDTQRDENALPAIEL